MIASVRDELPELPGRLSGCGGARRGGALAPAPRRWSGLEPLAEAVGEVGDAAEADRVGDLANVAFTGREQFGGALQPARHDQLHRRALEQFARALEQQPAAHAHALGERLDADPFALGQRCERLRQFGEKRAQFPRPTVELEFAGFGARRVEQLVHEPLEARRAVRWISSEVDHGDSDDMHKVQLMGALEAFNAYAIAIGIGTNNADLLKLQGDYNHKLGELRRKWKVPAIRDRLLPFCSKAACGWGSLPRGLPVSAPWWNLVAETP